MSFLITVYSNEGIVMASDRRSTYSNIMDRDGTIIRTIGIHTTNSTQKTFMCPNGAGISTCGDASLHRAPITGYIQEAIRTRISKECDVELIPNILIDYFREIGDVPNTNFIVSGYKKIDSLRVQKVYKVNIKEEICNEIDTTLQGATWDGETDTLTRLLQNVAILDQTGTYHELPYANIAFEFFTLQDAVDFARYAVETTIQTMHFKNVIETVGGGIDILVITPEETKWLQKAELT